jgi:hypothetical protein
MNAAKYIRATWELKRVAWKSAPIQMSAVTLKATFIARPIARSMRLKRVNTMTIIRGKRVVFEGGWMRLGGYAVKCLIRHWKTLHATDILN